jgi:hypothetical protein
MCAGAQQASTANNQHRSSLSHPDQFLQPYAVAMAAAAQQGLHVCTLQQHVPHNGDSTSQVVTRKHAQAKNSSPTLLQCVILESVHACLACCVTGVVRLYIHQPQAMSCCVITCLLPLLHRPLICCCPEPLTPQQRSDCCNNTHAMVLARKINCKRKLY